MANLSKKLTTPLGLDEPASIMEAFQDTGNEMLVKLREQVTTPHDTKELRTWGIVDAAKMIGVSAPTLRKQETEDTPLGPPLRDTKKRRIYTLDRINMIRNTIGTKYIRPNGSNPVILPVINFKGGSAKTTTTVHLAQKCALEGLRVLLIDFDPQGSATFVSSGIVPDLEIDYEDTIYTAMLSDPSDLQRVIRNTHFNGLDLIPGNLALQDLELALPNPQVNNQDKLGSSAFRLTNALNTIKDNYDVILIDCGPNLGVLTINAIIAANSMLVPIPPNMFDYASFIMLTGTLKSLFANIREQNGSSKKYDFFRILLTKHSGSNEAMQVENMIRTQFGGYVLANHMCNTVEIEKATNDIGTVYEISRPRGSKEAYRRALHHLESVNSEILNYFKQIWQAQSDNSNTTHCESHMEQTHE